MTSRSDEATITVEVPAALPPMTPAAVRLLAAMLRDASREAPVVELRIGRSPDEPEAVAS